jgi:hypothetical protein
MKHIADDHAQLNDKSLLKNQTYVNGEWIDAKSGKTFEVHGMRTHPLCTTSLIPPYRSCDG